MTSGRLAQQAYRRRRAAGLTEMVAAGPVRAHVVALLAEGMTVKAVADSAGVTAPTLSALLRGQPSKGLAPTRRVTQTVAARVLAVRPVPPRLRLVALDSDSDRRVVDATGTRRRVQGLVAMGRSVRSLADRLGMSHRQLRELVHGDGGCTARTARAVGRLYDELCLVLPPTATAAQRSGVTRAKAWAASLGWVPPLAWDDDTIDDPAAVPDLGAAPRSLVDLDDDEYLRAIGVPDEDIADRMGVTLDGLQAARRRARLREAS